MECILVFCLLHNYVTCRKIITDRIVEKSGWTQYGSRDPQLVLVVSVKLKAFLYMYMYKVQN